MKKSILLLAAFTFITGAILTSCNTPAQKAENAQDDVIEANKEVEKVNQEYLADMKNYRKQMADKIEANDQSIAEFKASIENEKAEAKAGYTEKIAVLEKKNSDMKMKMDNYKEEGKEKWEVFKVEFNNDMDNLGKTFKDLTVKNVEEPEN